MKRIILWILVLITWVSLVFAHSWTEYEPTSQDSLLLDLIEVKIDELRLVEASSIYSLLEWASEKFSPESRKYRFAVSLMGYLDHWILAVPEVIVEPMGPMVVSGDTIWVWYKGTLEDGTLFDTNMEEVAKEYGAYDSRKPYFPLEFEVGAGQMIAWFDKGVVWMRMGETKTITILPEDAYGFGSHPLAGKTLTFEVTVEWVK